MRRRDFVALLGSAATSLILRPLAARAQPRMPVIGYLGAESPDRFASRLRAFRDGLAAAGFTEGRNVAIEYRWAEGSNERLPALAAELVRHPVSVLAAPGSLASALAAKAATQTIPIVFETGADPVVTGLVASLRQPGGNITGVTSLNAAVGAKRLELLRELAPTAKTFALLVNPSNPKNAEATINDLQTARPVLLVAIFRC
jgi:putative ABC transport system substrate-binding protein